MHSASELQCNRMLSHNKDATDTAHSATDSMSSHTAKGQQVLQLETDTADIATSWTIISASHAATSPAHLTPLIAMSPTSISLFSHNWLRSLWQLHRQSHCTQTMTSSAPPQESTWAIDDAPISAGTDSHSTIPLTLQSSWLHKEQISLLITDSKKNGVTILLTQVYHCLPGWHLNLLSWSDLEKN